jgi:hypothetical protein
LFGRVVALQGLLGLVGKMSLNMQKVNVSPWELMEEQRDFYDKLAMMETALREQPSREPNPRWMSTFRTPFRPLSSLSFIESLIISIIPAKPEFRGLLQETIWARAGCVDRVSNRMSRRGSHSSWSCFCPQLWHRSLVGVCAAQFFHVL